MRKLFTLLAVLSFVSIGCAEPYKYYRAETADGSVMLISAQECLLYNNKTLLACTCNDHYVFQINWDNVKHFKQIKMEETETSTGMTGWLLYSSGILGIGGPMNSLSHDDD